MPRFQVGHPLSFEFASRLTGMVKEYSHVMFTNSGSESVDTALKIALAYQRNIGRAIARDLWAVNEDIMVLALVVYLSAVFLQTGRCLVTC
ncbi:MAG: hypothetical protein CM15mP62_07920 [Rhodospirillaceae bacterium]|nr:MAG: hypothetical protein CM15mP62_07920 [Rhodospirillaceae bacterium]